MRFLILGKPVLLRLEIGNLFGEERRSFQFTRVRLPTDYLSRNRQNREQVQGGDQQIPPENPTPEGLHEEQGTSGRDLQTDRPVLRVSIPEELLRGGEGAVDALATAPEGDHVAQLQEPHPERHNLQGPTHRTVDEHRGVHEVGHLLAQRRYSSGRKLREQHVLHIQRHRGRVRD